MYLELHIKSEKWGGGDDKVVRFTTAGFLVLRQVCYKIFHSIPSQAPRVVPPERLSKIDWSPTQPPTPDLFLRQRLSPLQASALSALAPAHSPGAPSLLKLRLANWIVG